MTTPGWITFEGRTESTETALEAALNKIRELESKINETNAWVEDLRRERKGGRRPMGLTEKRGIDKLPHFSGEKDGKGFKTWR